MMGQIISPVGMNETISEAAVMCGDPFFKDFSKNIYEQGLYRSMRKTAIDYQILDRHMSFMVEQSDGELAIEALNFMAEYRFMVNGKPYEKTDGTLEDGKSQYYVRYALNQFVFDYSNKDVGDKVDIFYKSGIAGSEDFEAESVMPVIPDYLYEELLKRLILYIANLGVVSFTGEKAERYAKVVQIYSGGNKVNPELHKNDQWVRIKPYQPL